MFDQNFLFMAFLMLCFAGLATMFYFLMRNIDDLTRTIKEDRNQMMTNMRALESSLNRLGDLLSTVDAAAPRTPAAPPRPTMPASAAVSGVSSRPAPPDSGPSIPDLSGRTLGYGASLQSVQSYPDLSYVAAPQPTTAAAPGNGNGNGRNPAGGLSSLPDLSLGGAVRGEGR